MLSGESQQADVLILGTSSIREGLWHEQALEAGLVRLGGSSYRIVNLATSAQSLPESLFLATYGDARRGQTVVLFISFGGLQLPDPFTRLERGAFLVAPIQLQDALADEGLLPSSWSATTGRMLLRWHLARQITHRLFRFGLKSWVWSYWYGVAGAPYNAYIYDDLPDDKRPDKQKSVKQASLSLAKNFDANMTVLPKTLTLLASSVQKRAGKLVIAMAPDVAPSLRANLPAQFARFESELAAFASRTGVEIVDWNPAVAWKESDSIDASHVSASGRNKWSELFLQWLANQRTGI